MKYLACGVCAGLLMAVSSTVFAADAAPAPAPAGNGGAAADGAAIMVPQEVIDEMSKLVEQAIQRASGPLQTGDEFEPYAVLKKSDGTLQLVRWAMPDPPPENMPPAMEIFRRIILTVVEAGKKNPDIIAAVTVAPTSVPTTDGKQRVHGIRAEVDHRLGIPQIVFIPYLREEGKGLIVGTPVYTAGTNRLFVRQPVACTGKPAEPAKPATKPTPKPAAGKASK